MSNIPEIPAKTIISGYSDGGWFASNYNMNIYKGCSHGCIYCDSRSECYQIKDFDTVRAKENALAVIERDLKSKRRKGVVITGSMSDPYNPCEKQCELTRGALNLIDSYGFGVVIDTKSDLVLRDIEILTSIKKHSPAVVNFTITTADDILCKKIEQNVCVSGKRFDAIKKLSQNNILCGVLLMPLLPFINDTEANILSVVNLAHQNGAKWVYPGFGVTLRQNQREYFYQKLDALLPGMTKKYIDAFSNSYYCPSPDSEKLWQVFKNECRKLGLMYHMGDISEYIKKEYCEEQIDMFF